MAGERINKLSFSRLFFFPNCDGGGGGGGARSNSKQFSAPGLQYVAGHNG